LSLSISFPTSPFSERAMSSGILIRPVRPDDVRDITKIYAHAVEHGTASFETEPPSEAEMATRQKMLLQAGYPYIVADVGGVVAGYAYAGAYRPRLAYRHTVEDSVYVHPRVVRRGVGRMLLNELISQAIGRGFRQMVAVIGDSGQTASIELHRALGFEPAGTLKNIGFKHGRWLDSVLMQRALGDGADTLP
jgi:phosphinothricin acetyltransferase